MHLPVITVTYCGLLAVTRATPRQRTGRAGGPVPARGPCGGPRSGPASGRVAPGAHLASAPGRRCVIPPSVSAGMGPPPARAAMLTAATRSRCPVCPQYGQAKTRPAGLDIRRAHAGQVEEVPRSSMSVTVIPAACALSDRARIRCPTRQARTRWLCRRPASRPSTPRGSPTASVPIRCCTAQPMTVLAGLVLGLAHPPPVPRLHLLLAAPEPPPPPRPPLPRPGRPPRHRPAAGPGLTQVLAALGADRPPGHQQQLPARPRRRIRVDDPQVDPGDPARIRPLPGRIGRDRNLRGHIQPQPARLAQHRHRPDLIGRIRRITVQPDHQRRTPPRHRQPQHPPVQPERARIPAHRDQAPAAPREPRRGIPRPASLSRREPRIGIPAQHRPGTYGVQLPERARTGPGQLAAQLLIPGQRRVLAAAAASHSAPARSSTHPPPTAAARTAAAADPR